MTAVIAVIPLVSLTGQRKKGYHMARNTAAVSNSALEKTDIVRGKWQC